MHISARLSAAKWLIAGMLTFVVPFLLVKQWWCLQHSPQLRVSTDEIDLGTIGPGQTSTATIQVQNGGNGLLSLDSLKTSCGCTVASVEKSYLNPRESTKLTVGMTGKLDKVGPQWERVVICSNDPTQRNRVLKVHAVLDAPYFLFPTALDFGTVEERTLPVQKSLWVTRSSDKSLLESFNLRTRSNTISPSLIVRQQGSRDEIIVTLPASSSIGPIEDALAIESTGTYAGPTWVEVIGKVVSDVAYSAPDALYFALRYKGDSIEKETYIALPGSSLGNLRVTILPPEMREFITATMVGTSHLFVRITGLPENGKLFCRTIIETPASPKISISVPIYGVLEH